jgi:hypothetical protein
MRTGGAVLAVQPDVMWVSIDIQCRDGRQIFETTWFRTDGSTLFAASITEAKHLAGGMDNIAECTVYDTAGHRLLGIR